MWNSILYKVRNIWSRYGSRYYCNLCGKYSRAFVPIRAYPGQSTIDRYQIVAMGVNPHYRCPWCNSSDKERLVWRYLTTRTDITTTSRHFSVLHIAPERNTRKKLQGRSHITYIHGDKFIGNPKYTSKHYGDATYIDVTNLSMFLDRFFDVIICNHVLEHVPDDVLAMRELHRVIKHDGFAILQVPVSRIIDRNIEDKGVTTDEERTRSFGQSDHVRIYAEKEYLERLSDAGFVVENILATSLFNSVETKQQGINQKESVYVVRKM